MKNTIWTIRIVLILTVLLAACGAPKPSPTPTPTPTPAPTPADATITFSGDTCTYAGPASISAGKMVIDWVVEEPDHDKYALVILTLQEGKTFEEIDQWPSADPPPWVNIVGFGEAAPNSRSRVTAQFTSGPLYFVCFYSPPDTKFETLGPVAVENAVSNLLPLATITPHAAPPIPASPRLVIIDTDMGADDWMAILYLLQRTDLSIQAITVSGTGLAHCDPGVQNALGLVALSGHAPIPAACGRETPLTGDHVFPESWRTAADTFMSTGISLPEGQNPASEMAAVALMADTIQAAPKKVTLLVLGPSTNLAELLQTTPAAAGNIERIYMMGGAIHVPGNLGAEHSENISAESNIYIDPAAANIVFESGIPLTLAPLDATNQAPITPEFYRRLQASQLTPEARWLYELFTKEQGYFQSSFYYFWDPLAAAILTDENLATYETVSVCVVEDEGPESGQTRIQSGCPELRVAISANAARFEQMFLDTLNNP